jgi:hypothetical protein
MIFWVCQIITANDRVLQSVGVLEFRPPTTAAEKSYFVEVKSKSSKLLVLPGLKFGFEKLLIDLPSSPNCCNTFVGCSVSRV